MEYEFLVVTALSVQLILGWDFQRNYSRSPKNFAHSPDAQWHQDNKSRAYIFDTCVNKMAWPNFNLNVRNPAHADNQKHEPKNARHFQATNSKLGMSHKEGRGAGLRQLTAAKKHCTTTPDRAHPRRRTFGRKERGRRQPSATLATVDRQGARKHTNSTSLSARAGTGQT